VATRTGTEAPTTQTGAEAPAAKGKSSGLKYALLGGLGALAVAGAGAAAYLFGVKSSVDPVEANIEAEAELPKEALYVPLDPPFTVNFNDDGRTRFLQVSIEAQTRDPEVAKLIEKHMPVIRNNLVLILSSQTAGELASLEGKERLREEARAGIDRVLEEEAGKGGVEAVYFTSFVMQ